MSFHKESEWESTDDPEIGDLKLSEKDAKLISYLARHGHWTPFGHAFLSFRIKAPIFVARQLVKHQVGLCWNEVSRRYVDDEPDFWFPKEWRGKPINAKQGSSGEVDAELQLYASDALKELTSLALSTYIDMVHDGIAPEQARMVLPLNTHTEWIWSGSLAAFARVVRLRTDSHAQAETREVAEKINEVIPESFKHSWSALLG